MSINVGSYKAGVCLPVIRSNSKIHTSMQVARSLASVKKRDNASSVFFSENCFFATLCDRFLSGNERVALSALSVCANNRAFSVSLRLATVTVCTHVCVGKFYLCCHRTRLTTLLLSLALERWRDGADNSRSKIILL